MSDQTLPKTPRDDDSVLAAEYVLGVLDAEERIALQARIDRDPDFARHVEAWENHLAGLNTAFDEVEPPAHLKDALERRLFTNIDSAPQAGLARIWNSVRFWRAGAFAATAALALLAIVTLREPPSPPATGETLLASLVTEQGNTRFVVLYDSSAQTLRASLVEGDTPAASDYELWFVPAASGGAPISLGLIGGEGEKAPHVPANLQGDFTDGATIAISLEPAGGSATGSPTGPVVAAAPVKKI